MIRTLGRTIALTIVGVLTSGCSGDERTLVPVTGTVTYNGAAVEGAIVSFTSAAVTAFDTTDAEGKFSLSTRAGDGAAPGQYVVTVRKTTQAAPIETPEDPMDVVRMSQQGAGGAAGAEGMDDARAMVTAAPEENLLPVVYATTIQTPLRDFTITPDGPNDFPIELRDDAVAAAELPTDAQVDPGTGE